MTPAGSHYSSFTGLYPHGSTLLAVAVGVLFVVVIPGAVSLGALWRQARQAGAKASVTDPFAWMAAAAPREPGCPS